MPLDVKIWLAMLFLGFIWLWGFYVGYVKGLDYYNYSE